MFRDNPLNMETFRTKPEGTVVAISVAYEFEAMEFY